MDLNTVKALERYYQGISPNVYLDDELARERRAIANEAYAHLRALVALKQELAQKKVK